MCFFYLDCDPKLVLQISGTFQRKFRNLHHKTEEADNAAAVKLSGYCDELGKMDLGILVYQTDIVATSYHDILLLYFGSSDTEVGPLLELLKLQHIFDSQKAVLHPLNCNCGKDFGGFAI